MLENRRDLPTPNREHGEERFGMGTLPQSPSDHANAAADNGRREPLRPSTATSRKSIGDEDVSPPSTPGTQTGKILLVEDNEINMNVRYNKPSCMNGRAEKLTCRLASCRNGEASSATVRCCV